MALFWIFFSLTVLLLALFFYRFVKLKKNRQLTKLNKFIILEYIGYITAFALFCLLMGIGICSWHNYQLDNKHTLFLVLGSLIFGFSFMSLLISFVTYFYKKELYEPNRIAIKTIMIVSIPLTIIFLCMALDAYAPYATFPLISGISFTSQGIKFHRAHESTSGFTINWYGIIILIGAIIAYVVCDRHFYKEYKRHGLIDALFIIVFIIGILGARLWSVAVLHDGGATIKDFFRFQDGGLAIMGGVLFGAAAGILYLLFFRRYINLRHAMDLILPCVLIAQGIGRWGNFFNQEVYGSMTFNPNTVWWLPEFIVRQMTVNGVMHLPLFLIECITNLCGYFVIVYLVRKLFDKHLSHGDLFCLYIVWYGLTRVILEPLRSTTSKFEVSLLSAWIMFGGGLFGIVLFHLYDFIFWKKKTFAIKDMKNKEIYSIKFIAEEESKNKFINFFIKNSNKIKVLLNKHFDIKKHPYADMFRDTKVIDEKR